MTLAAAIRTCLRKYVSFSGRASRSEYWYFVLFVLIAVLLAGMVDGVLSGAATVRVVPGGFSAESDGPVTTVVTLATILPLIAAGSRRMHDSGRSGLHLFYPVIVIVGITGFFGATVGLDGIAAGTMADVNGLMAVLFGGSVIVFVLSPLIVIYWLTRPSQPGANRYGPPTTVGAAP